MKPSPSNGYHVKWLSDGTPVTRAERRPHPRRWVRFAEYGGLAAVALVIALMIRAFAFQAFYIPSESMVPTLQKHDRVIVNKLSYHLHAVHRGDIIVFKTPAGIGDPAKYLVKRVIGLPGETIEASDGQVYIDGRLLTEPYLPAGTQTDPGFAKVKIPPGQYWVMGDNRTNSQDSRFFPHHFVPRHDIVGRVMLRVWPLTRIGRL